LEEQDIEPRRLIGVNYQDPAKVERIAESMRTNGWQGRRLLVEQSHDVRVYAWTGSHRIAAAKAAGLATVPCRIITLDEADKALAQLPDTVGYQSLRDALTSSRNGGGRLDRDRLAGLRRLGMDDAATALEEEIAAEEG
jgi:hypothetical protein